MSSSYISSGKLIVNAPLRRAFTLLEVVIAAAMLAVLLTTSVQMLRALSIHQRASERRAVALEAAEAAADQVANIPWDQLTAESAKKATIPKQLASYLPGAKLSVSLDEEPTPTPSRRIHIDLTWNGAHGQPVAPVRLTSWVFPERSRSE
jgi:prepilin-type N-terminal cleavage/methylation domain-containing protein